MSLQVEHREIQPGVEVVTLRGRVTLGEVSAGIEPLVQSLLDQGRRSLIFDMSGVSHIDSTGIGRFIASLNRVRRAGGSMRLAAAKGQVRDAFRITRLDTVFPFDDTVDQALKAGG
jgi:anti-anti-sigma factor